MTTDSTGPSRLGRLEVRPHRGGVKRSAAQGTRDSSTPFGELEALQITVQPSTTTRPGTVDVDDGTSGFTRTGAGQDHTYQDRPRTPFPAPHAHAHRARG